MPLPAEQQTGDGEFPGGRFLKGLHKCLQPEPPTSRMCDSIRAVENRERAEKLLAEAGARQRELQLRRRRALHNRQRRCRSTDPPPLRGNPEGQTEGNAQSGKGQGSSVLGLLLSLGSTRGRAQKATSKPRFDWRQSLSSGFSWVRRWPLAAFVDGECAAGTAEASSQRVASWIDSLETGRSADGFLSDHSSSCSAFGSSRISLPRPPHAPRSGGTPRLSTSASATDDEDGGLSLHCPFHSPLSCSCAPLQTGERGGAHASSEDNTHRAKVGPRPLDTRERRDDARASPLPEDAPLSRRASRAACGLAAPGRRTLSFKTEPFVSVTLDLSRLELSESSPPTPVFDERESLLDLGGSGPPFPSSPSAPDLRSFQASSCASSSSSVYLSPSHRVWAAATNSPPQSPAAASHPSVPSQPLTKCVGKASAEWSSPRPSAGEGGDAERVASGPVSFREPPPPCFLQGNPASEMVAAFYQFVEVAHQIRQEALSELPSPSRNGSSGSEGEQAEAETCGEVVLSTSLAAATAARAQNGFAFACEIEKISSSGESRDREGGGEKASHGSVDGLASALETEELAGSYRLLRFLQGYGFDVQQAAEAYRRHVSWRVQQRIDTTMRNFILREMVLPLAPERAPGHAVVSRNFPNNPLLRTDSGEQGEGEEVNDSNRPEHCGRARACGETAHAGTAPSETAPLTNGVDLESGYAERRAGSSSDAAGHAATDARNAKRRATGAEHAEACAVGSSPAAFPLSGGCESARGSAYSAPPARRLPWARSTHSPRILFDKAGSIITVERPGVLDERRLFEDIPEELFFRWQWYQLEFRNVLLDRLSRETGRLVTATFILDLQGFSAKSINRRTIGLLRHLICISNENYPESVGHIFFINTPRLFSVVWSTLQGWLNPRTISKIHLLEGDYEAVLREFIDPASLPPSLGGSCKSSLALVPTLTESEILSARVGGDPLTLHVGARRKERLEVKVPAGHRLAWAWVIVEHDVAFRIKWQPAAGGEERVLLDVKKHEGSKPVKGAVHADQEGTVAFVFDNSWSLFSSRTIFYKVSDVQRMA
ncbi:hypothetical protein BESB_052590 [Besnoitia besnoiti]|uniref:CRAL/TRIO domain-containing protein n=1 Tax=Besnoitia besnoiti TaxID=94643 RepID=A0A2A9MAV1_BESBE|nr:hypothetical protein BESB_052590 [Besnoitia besnoiti]PFH35608.1 hypothetical protein BESB_052590 [Besnoitia besnoiti]